MATNIDKSLYQAPMGLDDMDAEDIEIDVVDLEFGSNGLGDLGAKSDDKSSEDFSINLADEMTESAMQTLSSDLTSEIDNDKAGRKDWEKAYTEGLKLLGLQYEERTEPWNGACGVFHPMITEAVVRFQSETITETFPAAGPVKTKIIGKETPKKKEAAVRVQEDMNFQLTEKMVEFRAEHERMLWSLPATGSAFKKVYYDPSLGRQTSIFIPAEDILLPYGASDIQSCYRVTHVMHKTKNEILKLQAAGFYRECDIGDPTKETTDIEKAKDKETGFSDLNDDRFILYEIHADLDLKGFEDTDKDGEETGIMLPYVVTLIKGTGEVLAIRRNWEEDDNLRLKRQHFVHYQYIPGFGAYGFGLFHLIGGFAKSATSIMRQLVDAGTLSNLPGGLKTRGLRIKGDDTPIAPGEFRDVDVASGTMRDSIMMLPYKEPSQVLFTLLGNIVEEGRRFASTADLKISDMSGQSPVGTTLALLERQLKVMTAVQARVHAAFKQELKLLARIIADYTEDSYPYEPEVGDRQAKKKDYDDVDVIPVSDPNAATMSQRVVQYQAVIQMAQMSPDIYDLPQLHRNMLEVLGIKNADKLVPLPDDQKPTDPVTENMMIIKGEPVKAFSYQDQKSHIDVHQAMMQDPNVTQAIGQSPKASLIQGAMMAHIAEHVGFQYRQQIEQQLGMPMPPQDEKLPPEVETALSGMLAQAAQQVLQQNQAQASQQQAQQNQQDPLIQMQQQELQIKQQELQIKQQEMQMRNQQAMQSAQRQAQDSQMKNQLAMQQLQMKQQELQQQAAMQEKKLLVDATTQADRLKLEQQKAQLQNQLAGLKVGAQIEDSKAKLSAQQQESGVKMGIDVAKSRAQAMQQSKLPKAPI